VKKKGYYPLQHKHLRTQITFRVWWIFINDSRRFDGGNLGVGYLKYCKKWVFSVMKYGNWYIT